MEQSSVNFLLDAESKAPWAMQKESSWVGVRRRVWKHVRRASLCGFGEQYWKELCRRS